MELGIWDYDYDNYDYDNDYDNRVIKITSYLFIESYREWIARRYVHFGCGVKIRKIIRLISY